MEHARAYISGRVVGEPYLQAFRKFERYEYFYHKQDYQVTNPTKVYSAHWSWIRCMTNCVWALSQCKRMTFMPDWFHSRGAMVETVWALMLRKKIELTVDMS